MTEHRHVRLFRNGRNQAVRIPVEFELPGNEAIIHRDGERLVIEPIRKRGLVALLKTMKPAEIDSLVAEQITPGLWWDARVATHCRLNPAFPRSTTRC